jgi:ABC-type amino acid transport substrate-binding protein
MVRQEGHRFAGALVAALLAAALGLTAVACGSDDDTSASGGGAGSGLELKESGVLTIGANIAFAPFEYLDQGTQEPVGFDIDLGNEIAKRLGLEPRWLDNPSFDALIPALQDGQYDIVLSAMTITEERAKEIDFTKGYLDADQSLVVNANEAREISSAEAVPASAIVSVQKNTTSSAEAERRFDGKVKEIRTYDGTPEVLADVAVGRTQAAVVDVGAAAFAAKNEFEGQLQVVEILETGEELGIGLRKGNRALRREIERALDEIRADGTMDRTFEKWFGDLPGS